MHHSTSTYTTSYMDVKEECNVLPAMCSDDIPCQVEHLNTFFSLTKLNVNDAHIPSIAEALASPLKYAIFQTLGYEFIRAMEPINISWCLSGSLGSSASIGAWGGSVLTLIYVALLLKKPSKPQQIEEFTTLRSISSSLFQALGKELFYSAFAGIIGAAITGRDAFNNISFLVIAGLLGPIISMMFMFGILGMVIGVAWASSKFKDWQAGY